MFKTIEQRREQSRVYKENTRANDPDFRAKENEYKALSYEHGSGNTQSLRASPVSPLACPCCQQPVNIPSIDIVVDHYKVTPLEARILRAIWRGKGHPVQTERVFDAMYVDDPDGGPSPTRMYAAFKVALCHLRARLEGSGVSIENVGYRRGYRLVIGGK